jgi:tetratricopeptide (TPR) repeat protein
LSLVNKNRKGDKGQLAYNLAMVYLAQGNTSRATSEVEVLQNHFRARKSDRQMENRLNIAMGWNLCQTGMGDAGLKLLKRSVDKTKDDFTFHAWGHGADTMEIWGIAALQCGNAVEAEEAFLEALAHDAGSAKAAFGLYALCQKLNRKDEADRYLKLAQRCWSRADSIAIEKMKESMLGFAQNVKEKPTAVVAEAIKDSSEYQK